MKKFEIGKSYTMRSACDHDSTWTYRCIGRTAKRVTLADDDNCTVITRGIQVWYDVETCRPLGSYSMAPILSAD